MLFLGLVVLAVPGIFVLQIYAGGGVLGLLTASAVAVGVSIYAIVDAVRGARNSRPPASRARSIALFLVIGLATQLFMSTVVRSLFAEAYRVPTNSMAETLLAGDYLFTTKLPYGATWPWTRSPLFQDRVPDRGDVIVFNYPPNPAQQFLKRVIGLPGEQVEIVDKVVYIDDQPLEEDYVKIIRAGSQPRTYQMPNISPRGAGNPDNYGPVTVPDGQVFVLGDNRDNSDDSRFFGGVGLEHIRGRLVSIYFSMDASVRWNRIGRRVG
jgi:signal peptidase I